jgi:hypothetical protein
VKPAERAADSRALMRIRGAMRAVPPWAGTGGGVAAAISPLSPVSGSVIGVLRFDTIGLPTEFDTFLGLQP